MVNKKSTNLLKSSKYSMREKKYIFIGALAEIIFDKKIFPRNQDLNEYISIYEKILGIEPYKAYLYKSRTNLVARIVKDLFFNVGEEQIDEKEILKISISKHLSFIENYSEKLYINEENTKRKQEPTLLDDIIKSKYGDGK